jgi:hypothetical protein
LMFKGLVERALCPPPAAGRGQRIDGGSGDPALQFADAGRRLRWSIVRAIGLCGNAHRRSKLPKPGLPRWHSPIRSPAEMFSSEPHFFGNRQLRRT